MSTPRIFVPRRNVPHNTPRLPVPHDAERTVCHNKKRLIILCDGTCEDSLDDTIQNPTNITKISRGLSPNAWVEVPSKDGKKTYEQIEQIVFYQAGPGTSGNFILGAAFGTGLSEIVRSAYGFLCSNYNQGDRIYLFGFSRGAYVARSIAGLVAEHGLLSKRGLDNFHAVYNSFYNESQQKDTPQSRIDGEIPTPEQLGLRMLPRGTVEVVGVFDTVGFHNPIINLLNRVLPTHLTIGGDKNEFPNTLLSDRVKYAFHALSLDETRIPYQTTLFFQSKGVLDKLQEENEDDWKTTLKQMWFSGGHGDIGGGKADPRLSNIALSWMVSELVSRNLLEFDQNYLLDQSKEDPVEEWATADGKNNPRPKDFVGTITWIATPIGDGLKNASAWTIKNVFRNTTLSRKCSGVRTPGLYISQKANGKKGDPNDFETNEELHDSIQDRKLKEWPCEPLTFLGTPRGKLHERAVPPRSKKVAVSKSILQYPVGAIEIFYRGRVRDINKAPFTIPAESLVTPITETPISNAAGNPFRSQTPSLEEAMFPIE